MFPLKRRRKFARIHKKGLVASVTVKDVVYPAKVKDISASGCNIVFVDSEVSVEIGEQVLVEFTLNGIDFALKAARVRENGYNFNFEDRKIQTMLNNEVLVEYFKDTPELVPVDKALE